MILKRTKATQILSGYIVFLFASAAIIQLVEPDINRYGDALWYCYAVLSTAGFGDIVAMTFVGKLVSVLVTIYTIFVVAIVTGVVVNYYGQIVEMQRRETAMMFLDKLERLPELSKEELEDISKRVKKFRCVFTQRNFYFPLFSYLYVFYFSDASASVSLTCGINEAASFPFPRCFRYKIPITENTTAPTKFTIRSFIVSTIPMSKYPPRFQVSPLITTD